MGCNGSSNPRASRRRIQRPRFIGEKLCLVVGRVPAVRRALTHLKICFAVVTFNATIQFLSFAHAPTVGLGTIRILLANPTAPITLPYISLLASTLTTTTTSSTTSFNTSLTSSFAVRLLAELAPRHLRRLRQYLSLLTYI